MDLLTMISLITLLGVSDLYFLAVFAGWIPIPLFIKERLVANDG